MYSSGQTRQLQKETADLLKLSLSKKPVDHSVIESLRAILRFHEYRYYILSDPLISDGEYDQLYKLLEKIESENPTLVTPDSPTQRVAKGLTKEFATVRHLVAMLSLENSYNADDLIDWDRKAKELSDLPEIEYCIEPKFDGAGISLIYENDLLVRGITRGNGVEGDDITANIKQIRSIPLAASFSKYGIEQIEIRGEILLSKKNFKKYNEHLASQNLPPLANPRNAASGSLRIKDSKEVGRRNLEAFLYNISFFTHSALPIHKKLLSHSGCLELLWDLGFKSPVQEMKVVKSIKEVINYCTDFEQKRDDLPYEIDGMVIKVNNVSLQDKLGITSHHPRWAIACKFKARQATSKLLAVEFQVGRTGSITPVAKIDPVPIGGVTVTSISLFNEEVIKEKNLKIGDTVLVERAGDVIPYIVKSMPELRTGKEKTIKFPTHCPICDSKLVKPEEEAVWRCTNYNCPAQVVERIVHFASKDAMDIRGFGEAIIRKFHELGILMDLPGIYSLPFDSIRNQEGFGEKSILNLQKAIEHSKEQPLFRLIFALGIRYVGETTAKTLAHVVNHLLDLKDKSMEELQSMEDVGPKVATSIYQFFRSAENIKLLKNLEAAGLTLKNIKKQLPVDDNHLSGKTFLFTGALPTLKRNDAEAMVESKGGKLLGGVSSKLDYLVVGEDAGSKLEKAKKINSVKIISEQQFLQLLK